ncbi:RluA family pseudouridine synthase [Thermosulfuriphilus sp.]
MVSFKKLILYEDNHLLVVNKPAGLLTQGDITGEDSLFLQAKVYLKEAYQKPGNVYLGLVHRLDRITSGVLVLAKTSKAARRLSEQFRQAQVKKLYLAVVLGKISGEGEIWGHLLFDRRLGRVRVFGTPYSRAKEAHLFYRCLKERQGRSLLEIRPSTGRKHQIRALLASRGWPIVGDRRYGSRYSKERPLLHAWKITFKHPTKDELLRLKAPVPPYWPEGLRPRG